MLYFLSLLELLQRRMNISSEVVIVTNALDTHKEKKKKKNLFSLLPPLRNNKSFDLTSVTTLSLYLKVPSNLVIKIKY